MFPELDRFLEWLAELDIFERENVIAELSRRICVHCAGFDCSGTCTHDD